MNHGTVRVFPKYKLTDVAASLRTLADRIESGEFTANRCVVILEADDGTIDYKAFGEDFTKAHAAGICLAGANRIIE